MAEWIQLWSLTMTKTLTIHTKYGRCNSTKENKQKLKMPVCIYCTYYAKYNINFW